MLKLVIRVTHKRCLFQIEREIDEHLMPRLVNRSPSPEPQELHQPPHAQQPEPEVTRQSHAPPARTAPGPAAVVEAAPSVSSQSSPESDGAEPLQMMIAHDGSQSPYSQDSSSQQFSGAASREDQQTAKMGFGTFGSLKSGEFCVVCRQNTTQAKKVFVIWDPLNLCPRRSCCLCRKIAPWSSR